MVSQPGRRHQGGEKRALEKAQEERAAAAGLAPMPAMELSVDDAQRLGAGDSATK